MLNPLYVPRCAERRYKQQIIIYQQYKFCHGSIIKKILS